MIFKKKSGILCLLLVMALMIAMLAGCGGGQTSAQTNPPEKTQGGTAPPTEPAGTEPTEEPAVGEETIEPVISTEPTEPPVQVVMPEYEMTFSGTMADQITWEELTEQGGLCFYVKISTGKVPIFTLLLNQVKGDTVFMKENGAGEQIPVTFLMEAVPEGLSSADNQTFCMAQDIANDIVNSLILK